MSTADLPVPDEAMDALRRCARVGRYADDEDCDEDVRAISAPVVAAELRRMRDVVLAIASADEAGALDVGSALQTAGWLLTDRADELEQARTEKAT